MKGLRSVNLLTPWHFLGLPFTWSREMHHEKKIPMMKIYIFGLRFSFWALEVPEPRVRKWPL